MRIAAFGSRRWPDAVRAAGHECVEVPAPPNADYFESSVEDRVVHGRRLFAHLNADPVELILDAHGDGMLFVDTPRPGQPPPLLHEALGIPLVSHFTESLRILFKCVDPVLLHRCLQSPTWHKAIFTRAHVDEMRWMGIPNCFYLPLAADNAAYTVDPPRPDPHGPRVFFAGSQQSRYFTHGDGVDARTQWPGAMALAAVSDGSAASFLEAYRRYELGPSPVESPTETALEQHRADAVRRYYDHKMFFTATRNIATRDRFVYVLQKALGDAFMLVGDDRWQKAYGLSVQPRLDRPTYRSRIRGTPVCLNMVNGDNDSGLNLRHFEITALGGFLLTYHQPELDDLFEVGRECASFRNEKELIDQIRYYIEHTDERNHIAAAGQERTLRCHLLHHRVESIIAYLSEQGRQ